MYVNREVQMKLWSTLGVKAGLMLIGAGFIDGFDAWSSWIGVLWVLSLLMLIIAVASLALVSIWCNETIGD